MKIRRGEIEGSLGQYLEHLLIRCVLGIAQLLPFPLRLRFVGLFVSRVVAPLAGYGKRVKENLKLALPDLPQDEVKRLMRAVPANAGRTLAEVFSGREFKRRARNAEISGGGLAALEQARDRGQGVIFLSGHFGNYDVPRAVLAEKGFPIGAIYKPFVNPFFDGYYRQMIGAISQPIIPRGDRKSLTHMLKFLKTGGMIGILADVHFNSGAVLQFFDHKAATALSAAEMALKYDLLLVPVYGIRLNDRGDYRLIIEPPIPHSDPATMMQEFNDSLERQARAYPEQYFFIHRRWKVGERAKSELETDGQHAS